MILEMKNRENTLSQTDIQPYIDDCIKNNKGAFTLFSSSNIIFTTENLEYTILSIGPEEGRYLYVLYIDLSSPKRKTSLELTNNVSNIKKRRKK